MNWYSAYTWCQAQGMRLINPTDCNSLSYCQILKDISREDVGKWTGSNLSSTVTNISESPTSVYRALIGGGNLYSGHSRTTSAFALCVPNS